MSTTTTLGRDLYANGGDVAPVKIVGHSGAPGADGSTNRIGSLKACAFSTATGGTGLRTLSADVTFADLIGVTQVTHASVYNASDVCLHVAPLVTPRTGLEDGDGFTFKATGANAVTITVT